MSKVIKILKSQSFKTIKKGRGVYIEGLANKAVVDRGNDLIPPEAWQLDEFKVNPVILFNHDRDMPIGSAEQVYTDQNGLHVKARISSSSTEQMSYVRDMIKEGILRTFSVGFDPMDSVEQNDDGVNIIKQANLLEISVVTLPMNQESTFQVTGKTVEGWKTKTYHQACAEVVKAKGNNTVSRMHETLAACEKADHKYTKTEHLELVASKCDATRKDLENILSGDVKNIGDDVIRAWAAVFDVSRSWLKNEHEDDEQEKVLAGKTGTSSGERPHVHEYTIDGETKNGRTTTTEGEGPEHAHEIVEGQVQPGGDDDHVHSIDATKEADEEDEEDKEDDDEQDEKSVKQEFQECVASKIPKLLEDGKSQDEAVAIAISMCEAEKNCSLVIAQKQDGDTYAVGNEQDETEFGSADLTLMKSQIALTGTMVTLLKEIASEMRDINSKLSSVQPEDDQAGGEASGGEEPRQDEDLLKFLDRRRELIENFNKRIDDLEKQK